MIAFYSVTCTYCYFVCLSQIRLRLDSGSAGEVVMENGQDRITKQRTLVGVAMRNLLNLNAVNRVEVWT